MQEEHQDQFEEVATNSYDVCSYNAHNCDVLNDQAIPCTCIDADVCNNKRKVVLRVNH